MIRNVAYSTWVEVSSRLVLVLCSVDTTHPLTSAPVYCNIPKHHLNFVPPRLSSTQRRERFEKIYKLYLEGYSYRALGRQFGVSAERISQILRQNATPEELKILEEAINSRCTPSYIFTEINQMLEAGTPHRVIAESLKISIDTVKKASVRRNRRLTESRKAA